MVGRKAGKRTRNAIAIAVAVVVQRDVRGLGLDGGVGPEGGTCCSG